MDKILAAQPLNVPVMLVHSLRDQEHLWRDRLKDVGFSLLFG